MSRNILCAGCKSEFCAAPVAAMSERMGKCDDQRCEQIYHLGAGDRALGSFSLKTLVNRVDLDRLLLTGCGDPDCDSHHEKSPLNKLHLHSCCHNGAPLTVTYRQGGVLHLRCAVCNYPVLKVKVAEK